MLQSHAVQSIIALAVTSGRAQLATESFVCCVIYAVACLSKYEVPLTISRANNRCIISWAPKNAAATANTLSLPEQILIEVTAATACAVSNV
jgi:hypothetical protein